MVQVPPVIVMGAVNGPTVVKSVAVPVPTNGFTDVRVAVPIRRFGLVGPEAVPENSMKSQKNSEGGDGTRIPPDKRRPEFNSVPETGTLVSRVTGFMRILP